MNETLQLIDQLIAEHKVINERTASLSKVANDARLLKELKTARDTFVQGQPNPSQNLQKLWDMLGDVEPFLKGHFSREETILLPAVKKLNNEKLADALETRLFEHTDLRDRIAHSKQRVYELLTGKVAANLWGSTYTDIQSYLTQTWKLLGTHAANENRFFNDLRKQLKKAGN